MEKRGKFSLGFYAEKPGVLQSAFLFQVPRMWAPGVRISPAGPTGLWDHQNSLLRLSGNKVMFSIPVIGVMPDPNLVSKHRNQKTKKSQFLLISLCFKWCRWELLSAFLRAFYGIILWWTWQCWVKGSTLWSLKSFPTLVILCFYNHKAEEKTH